MSYKLLMEWIWILLNHVIHVISRCEKYNNLFIRKVKLDDIFIKKSLLVNLFVFQISIEDQKNGFSSFFYMLVIFSFFFPVIDWLLDGYIYIKYHKIYLYPTFCSTMMKLLQLTQWV